MSDEIVPGFCKTGGDAMSRTIGYAMIGVALLGWSTASDAKTLKAALTPPVPPIRHVDRRLATISGHKIRVSEGIEANVDCSGAGETVMKVVQQPQHGQADIVYQDVYGTFAVSDPRTACNTRRMPGVILYYTPAQSFVGQDHLDVLISYLGGTIEDDDVKLDIR